MFKLLKHLKESLKWRFKSFLDMESFTIQVLYILYKIVSFFLLGFICCLLPTFIVFYFWTGNQDTCFLLCLPLIGIGSMIFQGLIICKNL